MLPRYPDPDDAPWALLARHLATETTPEEQTRLHAWLHTDAQNLQILATVTRAWERAGEVAAPPRLFTAQEVEAAWRRFQPLILAPTASLKPAEPAPAPLAGSVVRPLWPAASGEFLLKLAAGVVLVGGAAYALTQGFPEVASKEVAVSYTTAAQRQYVKLPDGSGVWLNAHSQLRYDGRASAAAPRRVQLTGEAYFEVKPAGGAAARADRRHQ